MTKPLNYYGHAYDMDADDDRHPAWERQRNERGFDDTELWSLDGTLARFLAPRLKRFLQIEIRAQPSNTAWHIILQQIITACDLMNEDRHYTVEEEAKITEGFRLLGENLRGMWY